MNKYAQTFFQNFLGETANWYKYLVLAILLFNPLFLLLFKMLGIASAATLVGWLFIFEFILFLGLSLYCYPLLPGGLLALEGTFLGLCSVDSIYHEVSYNLPVILLLLFIVSAVGFLKDWTSFIFSGLLLKIRNKMLLSLAFLFCAAILSAFLDALTVTVVFMAVLKGAYETYQQSAGADEESKRRLRRFLRSLIMHAAVGTALGGVSTMVGEPQNLLIAKTMADTLSTKDALHVNDWNFIGFMIHMAPFTLMALFFGALTTIVVEKLRIFKHGEPMPESVYQALQQAKKTSNQKYNRYQLLVQTLGVIFLITGLALHLAEVGLIGLALVIFLSSFMGIRDEHDLAHAFKDSLPFTALLIVFFTIVAIIHDQHLFAPIVSAVFSLPEKAQLFAMYAATGILSTVSDNVFVATVFIKELLASYQAGGMSTEHFENMAIIINAGTNLPSIATPNGQAAFLLLLTSSFSLLIRLSYVRMMVLALPYTLALIIGSIAVMAFVF